MKIFRPLWIDGAFLTPQQFQQQTLWHDHNSLSLARASVAQPWGVICAEFDESALAYSRLCAERLIVRFPDGSLVDTHTTDILPDARDLSSLVEHNEVTIVLALPLLLATGGNVKSDAANQNPRRFIQEWVNVQDIAGEEQTDIAVLRQAISLRYAHEENQQFLTLPVARLIRNEAGQWTIDGGFIPPLMALSASPMLCEQLHQLSYRLKAKRRRLMALRRESNQRMADFAVADVSLFWLLNALNSHEPVIDCLLQQTALHPERLYCELARLAGSLLTFSLEHNTDAIPRYRHEIPEQVFPPLLALLGTLLEISLPSRVITVQLSHQPPFWYGELHDARLRENADFYLSVRSSLKPHLLQVQFPALCKVGSPDDVKDVINSALNGVPLSALHQVPAAIPIRLENQYFALDLNHSAAEAMLAAARCAFYVPATLGDIQLELFAVLRA